MAYCDLTDIQKYKDPAVYVQITNDLDGDTVDNGIIDEIVDKSANIIDSYIGGRYPLPLEVIPKIIRNIAIDLTVKFLYDRRLGEKDEIIEEARGLVESGFKEIVLTGINTALYANERPENKGIIIRRQCASFFHSSLIFFDILCVFVRLYR